MKKPWFKAKSYGYGSGPPMSWEGWAVLVAYGGAILGIRFLTKGSLLALPAIVVITGMLLWICHARTEGGWRWRRGGDD